MKPDWVTYRISHTDLNMLFILMQIIEFFFKILSMQVYVHVFTRNFPQFATSTVTYLDYCNLICTSAITCASHQLIVLSLSAGKLVPHVDSN